MLIRGDQALEDLARKLKTSGSFALDTEFIREHTYRPRLCLVQIAVGNEVFLVDPLATEDLTPIWDLVADPAVEKVLHSGEQDMEIFYAARGETPRGVFDTQVAAALAGKGESISYARLVEETLQVKLHKIETYTDWSRRPLSTAQIEYALDDVRYLIPIAARLKEELGALGRAEWIADELRFYEDRGLYEKDPAVLYRRIRGAAKLVPRDLAVLRELAAWREEEARRMDRPRGRILLDETLVELARRGPRTLDSIEAVRGVHPQLLRRSGEEILRRVVRARALPASEHPEALERRAQSGELSVVVDLLEVVLRSRADAHSIAPGYLGTRRDLEDLARSVLRGESPREPLAVLAGWRKKLVGEALVDLLEGKSHVAVDPSRARVEVVRR